MTRPVNPGGWCVCSRRVCWHLMYTEHQRLGSSDLAGHEDPILGDAYTPLHRGENTLYKPQLCQLPLLLPFSVASKQSSHFPSLQVGSPQGQAGTLKCSEERVRLCPWTEAWSCCPPMSMVGVVWPRHMGSTQDLSQYHAVPFSQPTYGSTCRALCVTPGACMPQGHPL